MNAPRRAWLLGTLSIVLPLSLANGCSSSGPADVTSFVRVDDKADGPPRDFDSNSDYAVAIESFHADVDPSLVTNPPRLVIKMNGLSTAPCSAYDVGCYTDAPDTLSDQRMSGDELADQNRFTVESPDASSDSGLSNVIPSDGVVGEVIGVITGTGTYHVSVKTQGFAITGVTFTVRIPLN